MNDFCRIWSFDETRNVDIDERRHQVLTIEAVHNSSMAWNDIAKVFDFECSLEATGKETTKGPNDGAEER